MCYSHWIGLNHSSLVPSKDASSSKLKHPHPHPQDFSTCTVFFAPNSSEVLSVQNNLPGDRHRDSSVLRHALIIYCIFLLGWIPIVILSAIDVQHQVDQVIYSSFHVVASSSSLIIMIYLILMNNEVKGHLQQKIQFWLQQ
jgi:hypothetical protein